MGETTDKVLKWLPLIALGTTLVAGGVTAQLQISANAAEVIDLANGVDENEEAIEEIQRLLIRRQGEVTNQVQRIELEQKAQGKDLETILRLLQDLQRTTGIRP